jgi:hypothetical protein
MTITQAIREIRATHGRHRSAASMYAVAADGRKYSLNCGYEDRLTHYLVDGGDPTDADETTEIVRIDSDYDQLGGRLIV